MKCLQEGCENEFESKTGRRKFCSNACKMKWHRKQPNSKNVLNKVQVQVLYNAMLEMTSSIKYLPTTPQSYDAPRMNNFRNDEIGQWEEPKKQLIRYPYETLLQMKQECENQEDWNNLKELIEASEHIPIKLRNTLLNKN